MAEVRTYEIYGCVEQGCGYYRDTLSTGVHVTGPELRERHDIELTKVVDQRDVQPLVEAARAAASGMKQAAIGIDKGKADGDYVAMLQTDLASLLCALQPFQDSKDDSTLGGDDGAPGSSGRVRKAGPVVTEPGSVDDGSRLQTSEDRQTLYGLATWLASMDEPGSTWRPIVTLQSIIEAAKEALANEHQEGAR